MKDKPLVSIIICTCNRAESLTDTLDAIGRLNVPGDMPAELLVVDNASADHTREVVEEGRVTNMPVRYVLESRPGKSHACNRGMREARGNIFLWTDDDVRPPVEWIEAMCRPIVAEGADAVAGRFEDAPHLARPWVARRRFRPFAPGRAAPASVTLIGGNMAFSRRVLDKVPAFDPDLGPAALGNAEDTLFSHQLHEAGFTVVEAPDVVAEHWFDEHRLTREAMLAAARKHGRSNAFLRYHWSHRERRWPRVSLAAYWLWYALFRLTHPLDRRREGCHRMEYKIVEGIAAFRQYLIERGRPRLYERRGLVRKGWNPATDGPQPQARMLSDRRPEGKV